MSGYARNQHHRARGRVKDESKLFPLPNADTQRKHYGRLVARILAVFGADPDAALTVADIAMPAYGVELGRVTKAHRVAVLRAMRRVVELEPRFGLMNGEGPQGQMVIYDRTWPLSYGLARLKADCLYHYQWEMPRWAEQGDSEEKLKAMLAPGGSNHDAVVPGGVWSKHCLLPQAEFAGDYETVARLKEENEREFEAWLAVGMRMFPARSDRDPAPVKRIGPDPAWDDDTAWRALWETAKGKRQRRDVVARLVKAVGGKVTRWSIYLPRDAFYAPGQLMRDIEWWAGESDFGSRIFHDDELRMMKTVSSGVRVYTEETPKPGGQTMEAVA
jgi:hypothetical protein